MNKTIAARLQFIEGIEVQSPPQPATAASNQNHSASVVESAMISFVGNIYGQQKSAVVDSLLFAQLAANNKYDRLESDKSQKWYDYYRSILETVGWNVSGFQFVKFKPASNIETVDKAVLFFVEHSKLFNSAEQAQLVAATNALQDPINQKAYTLFSQNTGKNHTIDFQLGLCEQDKEGRMNLRIMCCNCKAEDFNGDTPFFPIASGLATFTYYAQQMVMNEGIYSDVRESINDKFSGKFKSDLTREIVVGASKPSQ